MNIQQNFIQPLFNKNVLITLVIVHYQNKIQKTSVETKSMLKLIQCSNIEKKNINYQDHE